MRERWGGNHRRANIIVSGSEHGNKGFGRAWHGGTNKVLKKSHSFASHAPLQSFARNPRHFIPALGVLLHFKVMSKVGRMISLVVQWLRITLPMQETWV